jgi:hypothetical protein
MRFALFIVVTAALLASHSLAQVRSIEDGPTLETRPHAWRRVLQNQSTSSLVAYIVGCNPEYLTTVLQDTVLLGGRPIGPGESIDVGVNDPSLCDSRLRAAIFSDGHAEGDPEFVEMRIAVELVRPSERRSNC